MGRILVTGATGFVGRRLVPALEGKGFDVVGLGRSATAEPSFVAGDIASPVSYEHALESVDTVVHMAAATGKARRSEHYRVNLEGTEKLLAVSERAGVERFVFVSTIAVTFPDKRRYHYALAKEAAEAAVSQCGMDYAIVRPTIVAGPGSPVLAGLQKLSGLPVLPVFGSGAARVQPIYVDDLTYLLTDVVGADRLGGETLEFGGPSVVTMEELLQAVRGANGKDTGRAVHIPLGPLLPLLAAAETIADGMLPVTVGQLASFRFDGVAAPNRYFEARKTNLTSVPDMLSASF